MKDVEDEKSLLEPCKELHGKMIRMSKLQEYTECLHETFRTVPLKSELLLQAEDYFYEGKFQEMDEILDVSKIRAEIESLEDDSLPKDEDREKKARVSLKYRSYELVVKALYHYTFADNPQWREDVYNFLDEAEETSSNVHTMYEFGSCLSITDEQEWALELLNDAYVASQNMEGEAGRLYEAKCLWRMGIILSRNDDYPKAIEYAGKILKIYSELSENNHAEYCSRMSEALVIMGEYHIYIEKNLPAATVVFEEAVKIRRELAVDGGFERAMRLADALDKLATVYVGMREYGKAFSIYEEALKIREDNMDYDLYSALEMNAGTLHSIAIACYFMHEYEKAIDRVNEELEIRRRVQKVDFFGQLPGLAITGNLLGDLYLRLNRSDDAIREREKVVDMYRTLNEYFPDIYVRNLGEALINCTNIYLHTKSYDKYFRSMMEALKIFRKLAATNREGYISIVGRMTANVCHYYERIYPDRKKAIEYAREAYKILSSIERNEEEESVFVEVKRIIKNSKKRL
jgi:tetratricopeptide (TPR) repeat protein